MLVFESLFPSESMLSSGRKPFEICEIKLIRLPLDELGPWPLVSVELTPELITRMSLVLSLTTHIR